MPKANKTINGGPRKIAPKASGASRQPPKSAEFIISSESDSDSSGKSSGSESDSSEQPNNKKPVPREKQHTKRSDPPVSRNANSGSDSEESSSSGRGSSNSSSSATNIGNARTTSHGGGERTKEGRVFGQVDGVESKCAAPPSRATEARPRKPYEPPHGFQPFQTSAPSASTMSEIIRAGNLYGKQIWHIAAAASIPLQSITEVALNALAKGDPVLQHKGIDYSLSSSTSEEVRGLKTLVPSESEDVYRLVSIPIARSLQLQQVMRLPSIEKSPSGRGPSGAASVQTPAIKKARPQPKGLKMRYLPSGFGAGNPGVIGSSSSEDSGEDEESQSQVLMSPNLGAGQKKRKLEEVVNGDSSNPSKKIRTEATIKAQGVKGKNATGMDGEKLTGVNGAESNPTTNLHKSNHTGLEFKDRGPDGSKEKIEESKRRADKERRRKERQDRRENKAKTKETKKVKDSVSVLL